MQIEWHVQPLELRPERPILRQVVIEKRIRIGALREAVGEDADKAELLHASDELTDGELRILQRQRRQPLKALRALGNLFGQHVVGALRHLDGAPRFGDGLDGRGIEGQEHHLDAVLVHQSQPPVLDVGEPIFELGPMVGRHERLRLHHRLRNREVLL